MQRRGNSAKDGYVGIDNDHDGGMTFHGRLVLDARVFGLIEPDATCAGWTLGSLQSLIEKVQLEWDKYGNIPSRLPDELRARHEAEYEAAIERARKSGWDPDLSDEQ